MRHVTPLEEFSEHNTIIKLITEGEVEEKKKEMRDNDYIKK